MQDKTLSGDCEAPRACRRADSPLVSPPEVAGGAGLGGVEEAPVFPSIRPRWLGRFLGREILRVCPEAKKEDPCEGCSLRVFCRCAQADFEAAEKVERRVWAVIAISAAAVLLYAIL